jgi:hypothetical protein
MHYLKLYFQNFWQPKSAILELEKAIKSPKTWIILLFVVCLIGEVVDFWLVLKHPEWQAHVSNLIVEPWSNEWFGLIIESIYQFVLISLSITGTYFVIKFLSHKPIKYLHLILWITLVISYGIIFQLFNILLLDLKDFIPLIQGHTQHPYTFAMIWVVVISLINLSSILKFNILKSFLTCLLAILIASLVTLPFIALYNYVSQTTSTERLLFSSSVPAERVIKNPNKYLPLNLYEAADELFVAGRKDEAMFWYYTGQLRARYDANRTNDITAGSGVTLLNNRYGSSINKYAFTDIEKLKITIKKVVEFVENNEEKYNPSWLYYHGMAAFIDSDAERMKPRSEWPEIKKQTIKDYQTGFIEALKQNNGETKKDIITPEASEEIIETEIKDTEESKPEIAKDVVIIEPEIGGSNFHTIEQELEVSEEEIILINSIWDNCDTNIEDRAEALSIKKFKDVNLYSDISPDNYSIEGKSIYSLALINLNQLRSFGKTAVIQAEFYGRDTDLFSTYIYEQTQKKELDCVVTTRDYYQPDKSQSDSTISESSKKIYVINPDSCYVKEGFDRFKEVPFSACADFKTDAATYKAYIESN